MGGRSRSSARVRRGALLVALASTVVLVLALMPGAAQGAASGLVGANQLTVQLTGNGAGRVVQSSGPGNGTPQAINCASTGAPPSTGVCVAQIPFGDPPPPWVGVTAQPPAGAEFTGWTVSPANTPVAPGYCGQAGTCIVQVGAAVTVFANFTQAPGAPLIVLRQGPAASTGTVTSNPAGINCSPTVNDCTASFAQGAAVVLTAAPGAGATFGGWSGTNVPAGCGANPTCTITSGQVLAITATFNVATFPLTVSVTGDGGVSSNLQPPIQCSTGNVGTCTESFASGSEVSLTAHPDSGWNFTGWGGACAGNANPCVVTMSQAQNVSATFVVAQVQANVTGNKVIYRSNNPRRVLQIKFTAQQEVNVKIVLRRGGVNYGSKTYQNVDPGASVRTLNVKNSVAPGKYTAVVTFTNSQGAPPLTQNRNVKLKAVPS